VDSGWDGGIEKRTVGNVTRAAVVADRKNGHEATYHLPGFYPKWGHVLTPTGRPCLTFEGAEGLWFAGSLPGDLDGDQPYTAYAVKRSGASSTQRCLWGLGSTTGTSWRATHEESSLSLLMQRGEGVSNVTSHTAGSMGAADAWAESVWRWDGAATSV